MNFFEYLIEQYISFSIDFIIEKDKFNQTLAQTEKTDCEKLRPFELQCFVA